MRGRECWRKTPKCPAATATSCEVSAFGAMHMRRASQKHRQRHGHSNFKRLKSASYILKNKIVITATVLKLSQPLLASQRLLP